MVLPVVASSDEYAAATEQRRGVSSSTRGKRADFLNGVVAGVEELNARNTASTVCHSPNHQHVP